MPNDPENPAAIAAAVRTLAGDVHRALARAAADESTHPDAALADLQQWAGVLLDLVGEGRPDDLRHWLRTLQQRIFVARWLYTLRRNRRGVGGPGQGGPLPIAAAT